MHFVLGYLSEFFALLHKCRLQRKSDDHDLHCFLISIFTAGLHLDGALRRVDDVLESQGVIGGLLDRCVLGIEYDHHKH